MLLPTAPEFLRLQARRRGAEGGLAFAGDILPFAVLADAAESLAAWLARRGLGAGQPVGVMAGNVPAMVAMLYATWGLGAVAVPVSVRSKAGEAHRGVRPDVAVLDARARSDHHRAAHA
jgi:acyl-CoA synthetase (AMP-forming)/AMP-acid ligase II